jgi:hypothetical protein
VRRFARILDRLSGMPMQHPTGGAASRVRTIARLLLELAGFAVLLFITRFVARGHLVPESDQECYIGGIALDVLAHGVRFPIVAYAPNEYDNGSFFSGLLAAGSFAVLGQSVLALKLVTHLISAAGAVATLWLLRGCLQELGLTRRRERWTATAVLVVAIALAPRVVTIASTYAVGNHAEGSAIGTILLALFSRRLHVHSALGTAGFWALAGVALYLNKATTLVIPALAVAQIALTWRSPARLVAAGVGFVLGLAPELLVIAEDRARGWVTMSSKAGRYAHAFPHAFLDDVVTLAEHRVELLCLWGLAIIAGIALLLGLLRRAARPRQAAADAAPSFDDHLPVALGLAVMVTLLHLAALTVMAQGGLDYYAIYGYPTGSVLVAVLVAWACGQAGRRWGDRTSAWVTAAAIALILVAYRPDALSWGLATSRALWGNQEGAVCSWRFAEGFLREYDHGLAPPEQTREAHAIERCRSLSTRAQTLDCIGGIARELHWRHDGKIDGEPPVALDADERRVYAYHYGTHRHGDVAPCADFTSPSLSAECVAAVQLECLVFGDMMTRFVSGQGLARPRCTVPEPPMVGYWSATRTALLTRTDGTAPQFAGVSGDTGLGACGPIFATCY